PAGRLALAVEPEVQRHVGDEVGHTPDDEHPGGVGAGLVSHRLLRGADRRERLGGRGGPAVELLVVTVGHDAPSVAERFALQTTLPAGGPVVKARARPTAPNRTFTALCNSPGFTALRNNRRFHRTLEHGPTARDPLALHRTPCASPGFTAVLAAPSSRR